MDIPYEMAQEIYVLAEGNRLDPDEERDLVGCVWDLANKRDHEWLGNEKEYTNTKLKELLAKYINTKN